MFQLATDLHKIRGESPSQAQILRLRKDRTGEKVDDVRSIPSSVSEIKGSWCSASTANRRHP